MLALSILVFLLLAIVLFCLDLRQTSESDERKSLRRTISYAALMILSVLITFLHFWKIEPLVKADKLEVRGQYFPLDKNIQISADPLVADYYCPMLLARGEVDAVNEDPLIELSNYDDQNLTLQAVARRMARPLTLKEQILNLQPLSSQSSITVNSVPITFSDGWLAASLTINGTAHQIDLPGTGESVSIGGLLCQAGVSKADQSNTFFGAAPATTPSAGNQALSSNPLDSLWIVGISGGDVGLVNGSSSPVQVDGVDAPAEIRFTVKSGDSLTYGVGRRAVALKVQIEPALNRIYIIPEKPQMFPLYRPPSQEPSSETEIFITSGIISPSPAYQIDLGDRNVNLVKAGLRYSLAQPPRVKDSNVNQEQAKKQELLRKGYIVNTGVEERVYAFDEMATIGSNEGGVLISIAVKQRMLLLTYAKLGLIWLIPLIMFGFLGGIQKRNYLYVLLPLVQLILGIRLILSYRGFVLAPYINESYEKALLAALFIPFAIFVWLQPGVVCRIFDFRHYPDSYRRIFSRDWVLGVKASLLNLFRLPVTIYFAIIMVFIYLDSTTSFLYPSLLLPLAFFLSSLIVTNLLARKYSAGTNNPLVEWIRDRSGSDVPWLFAIPLVTALLLKVLGFGAERLPVINLRAELLYASVLLLASCRFYSWFFQRFLALGKSVHLYHHLLLLVPLLLYGVLCLVVGDFGFLIYAIPIFFLALIVSWRAGRAISYSVFASSLVVAFILMWTPLFSRSMPAFLKDSAIQYRFLAYQNPGWLEDVALQSNDNQQLSIWQRLKAVLGWAPSVNKCETGNTRARRILGVHEHFWTMFHFAARGRGGEGYGRSPIERVPFANGIAQSDNVYSVYIMSEHGGLGGIAVISVYVVLVFMLLFILTQHFASDLFPTLILSGIAMTILFTALYHAAGNVGGVPFTGKNLPLLSLNSNSDIVLLGILLSLAFSVIGNEIDLSGNNQGLLSSFRGSGNALNKWLAAITLFFTAFYGFVIVKSWHASEDELHRGDYDLAQFVDVTKDYIKSGIVSLDPRTQQIAPLTGSAAGLGAGQYLRLLIDQFNRASAQDKVNGRHFFMVRDVNIQEDLYGSSLPGSQYRETILSVDENYFRRASPFAAKVFWQGGLRSADSIDMQDFLSGEGLLLVPKHELDLNDPIPGTNHERKVKTSNQVHRQRSVVQSTSRRFKVSNQSGVHLFDLYAIEGDTVLEPQATRTFVNGQECRNKTRLEPGDVIAIDDSGRRPHTLTFFYQKDTSGLIAGYRWINGREDFVYPQGAAFSLARPIVDAINSHVGQLNQKTPNAIQDLVSRPLTLSIDAELQNRIYEELASEGTGRSTENQQSRGLWDEINGRRGLAPRISATVMSPESGEVLALASWPSYDPAPLSPEQEKNNPRAYSNLLRRRDPEARLYLTNHNLDRHVLGSATKPFIASAAATAFPELLSLSVYDNKSAYESVFGIPTKPAWQGNASGTVDFAPFLIHSNNLYEVTIGFLGLAEMDQSSRLRLTSNPIDDHYVLNGRDYAVQPDFTDTFETKTGEALNLDRSHLAVKLNELFDLQVSGPDLTRDTGVWSKATEMNLLPDQGGSLNFISPETSNLALNRIRDARSFVGVTLGGNTNRWNNVKSAEAFARLVTGRRVEASFVKLDQQPNFPSLNSPFSVVRSSVLDALEGVAQNGTASALAPLIARMNANTLQPAGGRLTIFAKTGTLEGQFRSGRNDSNIIFAVGIWNDINRTFANGVVVSIYIEKGNLKGDSGRATQLAGEIIEILNQRFKWSG